MARYNTFVYGDGTKYGVSVGSETGDLIWIFQVDWDGNGVYDGANEAAWAVGMKLKRGRQNYLNPDGGGFEHMRPDTLTLTMDDPDRRYDPRNDGSPLYPNVFPGKKCQLRVVLSSNGTSYTRFTGYIDAITPNTRQKTVTLDCKGYLQVLADQELTTETARLNTTITQALTDLLADAHYPGPVELDADAQPVISFSINRQKAGQVAGQLADAALGVFFNDKNGKARFFSRDHSYGTTHTIDESQCLKEIEIAQPWENVFKQVRVIARRQVKELESTVFFLPNPVAVTASATTDIFPSYDSCSNPQISALEANTADDGSGSSITADLTRTTYELGPTGGQISYYAATSGYITKLEIKGRRWRETEEAYEVNTTGEYDRRFTLDSPWLQDRNYAAAFKSVLLDFLDDDRESLVIQIETRPTVQFAIDVMDKVDFTSETFDIDDSYWVLGFDEEWLGPTGQGVLTTLYLHKILTDETEITPAPVDVEAPTPDDYNNPGGTGGGGGGELPEGTFYSRACSVYGSASLGSNSVTAFMTFTTEVADPDSMINAPSTDITIPDDGQYYVQASGRYYAVAGYSASADETGACGIILQVRIYRNGVLQTNNAGTASSRFAHQGSTWQAYANPFTATMLDLVGNDVIKVDYVTSMFGTPDTSVATRAVMIFCNVYKIRGS